MPINSRQKGARGERLWRDQLREQGFTARRGQQFSGGPNSPDVICEELTHIHQEVKMVEKLNLDNACAQAARDGNGKPWIVAHKKNRNGWRVTMSSETFFALLRDGMEGLKLNETNLEMSKLSDNNNQKQN
jgi:Holliday junction resolvase